MQSSSDEESDEGNSQARNHSPVENEVSDQSSYSEVVDEYTGLRDLSQSSEENEDSDDEFFNKLFAKQRQEKRIKAKIRRLKRRQAKRRLAKRRQAIRRILYNQTQKKVRKLEKAPMNFFSNQLKFHTRCFCDNCHP